MRFQLCGRTKFLAVLFCFFFFYALGTRAQGTADIVGTVTDSSGGVLPNAMVTVKNLDTNVSRSMQSQASGDYAFTLLPIGNYSITVEASGFKMFTAPRVTIATGDRARVDAQMQVGAISQTVEVQAEVAAALQTDSSAIGSLITSQATQDLPLNGRNIIQLVTLSPGTSEGSQSGLNNGTRPDDRRQTSTIFANGQGGDMNNYMLDGMDNNERMIGTIIVKPSVDALQEVKVQTNLFTASDGRAGGAVVNMITKSGSNALHGDAFEFLRNDIFDAKNYFNQPQAGNPLAGVRPEFRQNQFGGSLGGAIKKDKLFFFGDYEGLRIVQGFTQPTGTGVIPTACEFGQAACNGVTQLGNFSDLLPSPGYNCNPIALGGNGPATGCIYDPATTAAQYAANGNSPNWFPGNIIPLNRINTISNNYTNLVISSLTAGGTKPWPVPESSCSPQPGSCIFRSSPNRTQYSHTGDLRLDQHISDSDNLFERYTINQVASFFPGAFAPVNVGGTLIYPGGTNGNPGSTSFPGNAQQRAQSLSIGETHVFRSTLIMQENLQVSRYASASLPPDANVALNSLPAIGGPTGVNLKDSSGKLIQGFGGLAPFSYGYSLIGDAFALPTEYFDTDFQGNIALTWTKGPHTIKFGGSFIRRYWNVYNSLTKGNFNFAAQQTNSNGQTSGGKGGNGFASMLLGIANTESQGFQLVGQEYRANEIGAFAQDDWRAGRHLTLNLGVRWDVFTPTTAKHNDLAVFDPLNPSILAAGTTWVAGQNGVSSTLNMPLQLKDFQPRVGFAYTGGHSLVIRGGFGTTNYPGLDANQSLERAYPMAYNYSASQIATGGVIPYPVTGVNINTGLPAPTTFNSCVAAVCGQTAAAFNPSRGFLSTSGVVTQGWTWPTVYQYNLVLEKEFAGNVASIGYLGEETKHLGGPVNWDLPLPPNGPGGCNIGGTCGASVVAGKTSGCNTLPNTCQPFFNQLPLVTSTSLVTPFGSGNYNALQAKFQRRYRNGLTFVANYTYAQALTNIGSSGIARVTGAQVWNNFSRDYGNSDYEIRHRVTATANYQLPFGKSMHGMEGQFVKGWQVNGLWVWSSGLPFNVTDSEGLMQNSVGGYRVNQLKQQPFTRSLNEWFNTDDFAQQPAGTASTIGSPAAYFSPSFTHMDLSLFKEFSLTERFKLQFRYEVFNIFNTPAFTAPSSAIPSWQAGPGNIATCPGGGAGGVLSAGCVPFSNNHNTGSFGSITATNVYYTPRDMQFALKLSF